MSSQEQKQDLPHKRYEQPFSILFHLVLPKDNSNHVVRLASKRPEIKQFEIRICININREGVFYSNFLKKLCYVFHSELLTLPPTFPRSISSNPSYRGSSTIFGNSPLNKVSKSGNL